jgi:hypothetical protein
MINRFLSSNWLKNVLTVTRALILCHRRLVSQSTEIMLTNELTRHYFYGLTNYYLVEELATVGEFNTWSSYIH